MQKLKHTKKPFWQSQKESKRKAIGALFVAVGLIGFAYTASWPVVTTSSLAAADPFNLPDAPTTDFSADAQTCTRVFDACGPDNSCTPVSGPGGKLIPRACSAGECRSTSELQNKYKEVAENCRQANFLRHDAEMRKSNWQEMIDNLTLSYGIFGNADDISNINAENLAKMKAVWDKGKDTYQQTAKITKALRAGASTAYQAIEWGKVATGAGLMVTTKFTEYQLSRASAAAEEMFDAETTEANANWQACLNEAKSIKATEQQLLSF